MEGPTPEPAPDSGSGRGKSFVVTAWQVGSVDRTREDTDPGLEVKYPDANKRSGS